MQEYLKPALSSTRQPFTKQFPRWKEEHRTVQSAMFATADELGLPIDTRMIGGINKFFGLELTSRTQLTIDEMHATISGMMAGVFDEEWNLVDSTRCRIDGEPYFYQADEPVEVRPETLDEYLVRIFAQFDADALGYHLQCDDDEFADLEEYELHCAHIRQLIDEHDWIEHHGPRSHDDELRLKELKKELAGVFETGIPVPLADHLDESELIPLSHLEDMAARAAEPVKTQLRLVA